MSDKLKYAVIGTGSMGQNHVRTVSLLEQVNFVAIAEIDERLGKNIAEQYKVKFYYDYKDLIEQEKPDIISICTWTKVHYEIAKYCIQHHIHLLLEKPITNDISQAEELLQLAKENNVCLLIGHIERFNPAVKKVKEIILNGEIGELTAITFKRVGGIPQKLKDVNIVVDLAIHDIDISNYLLGKLPNKVSMHSKKNHLRTQEDSVEIFMEYENVSSYIQANWITPLKIRELTLTGTNGYLKMDFITQSIEFYKNNIENLKNSANNFSDYILRFGDPDKINISVAKKEPLKEEILYLIDMVSKGECIDCNFAVDALKIALSE